MAVCDPVDRREDGMSMMRATLSAVVAILTCVVMTACGAAPTTVKSEPKARADCDQYTLAQPKKQCSSYLLAALAAGNRNWGEASDRLDDSGLRRTKWGKALAARIKTGRAVDATADLVDPASVVAVEAKSEQTSLCPGERTALVLTLVENNGTRRSTWTDPEKRKGFVDPSAFVLASPQGTFDNAVFIASDNVASSIDGFVVTVSVKDHADLTTELTLMPSYDCMKGIVFPGTAGSHGDNGAPGSDGGNGGVGGAGPTVVAEAMLIASAAFPKLLIIKAVAKMGADAEGTPGGTHTQWYAAAFTVDMKVPLWATGGPGGPGGSGGAGANGGNGGAGGIGGSLEVRYDKRSPEIAKVLDAQTTGGAGGAAGRAGGKKGQAGTPGVNGADGSKPKLKPEVAAKLFVAEKNQ